MGKGDAERHGRRAEGNPVNMLVPQLYQLWSRLGKGNKTKINVPYPILLFPNIMQYYACDPQAFNGRCHFFLNA